MNSRHFSLLLSFFMSLLVTSALAQETKAPELPKPAQSATREFLWAWNDLGRRLTAMAEDFPEEKYSFKAQKDERTFSENLIHVVFANYELMSAIKGSAMGPTGNEDTLRKKYPLKADVVKLVKQSFEDGVQLIKEQGENGFTREFKYPWGNLMVHGAFGWWGMAEHSGEHYGQLVVYYRVNGMIPPESRPKK
jgi:hypothetical protein